MSLTPMMQQYQDAKEKHPGTILLFRMGDFYELFGDDAILISKQLQLTLTSRAFYNDQLGKYAAFLTDFFGYDGSHKVTRGDLGVRPRVPGELPRTVDGFVAPLDVPNRANWARIAKVLAPSNLCDC